MPTTRSEHLCLEDAMEEADSPAAQTAIDLLEQQAQSAAARESADQLASLHQEIRSLREENTRLRFMLDSHPDYLCYLDQDLYFTYVNAAYREALDIKDESSSVHMPSALSEAAYQKIEQKVDDALAGQAQSFEVQLPLLESEPQDLRISYAPHISGGNTGGIAARIQNVTLEKRAQAALEHQASHDILTGLPNRTLLMDRMEHALAKSRRQSESVAVAFVDLNEFKAVNDEFGHDVGDDLLKQVADALANSVRSYDTVCRYGGDEFVLLLEDFSDRAIPAFADALQQRLAGITLEYRDLSGRLRQLGARASIGFSISSAEDSHNQVVADQALALVRDADKAMYRAKCEGRFYILHSPATAQTS